jgi:tRNA pseudouridine13 synthase
MSAPEITDTLPYLTRSLPGTGGRVKVYPEDFIVDEVPLYEACGEGTHTYFQIEKRGIPTPAAVSRIARAMGVRPQEIGLAGLKDAHAISRQYLSLEHADEQKIAAYSDPQIRVLWVGRHRNKLKPGHLAANRFTIRLRDVGAAELDRGRAILDTLTARGVPNYFGEQRFGKRGDTAELGRALLSGNLDEFMHVFLGRPRPDDPPDCRAARDAFEVDALDRAMKRWPRHYSNERRALAAYRKGRKASKAVGAIDKRMRRLYVSAFQSAIFNAVLARRIDTIDRLLPGDLAKKTDTGGVFPVDDPATEQPRCENWEISPTGPLPGQRERLASSEAGDIERSALEALGVTAEDFDRAGSLKVLGTRRPLRWRPEQAEISAGLDAHGEYLELSFCAPPGCYATVAVEEITKTRQPYIAE